MAYSLDLVRASGIPTATRAQWGNRYPYSNYTIKYPGRYLFMHITVTHQTGTLAERTRVVERIGAQRFPNTRFSYNAVLHRGGAIYEGQPRGRKGAHTVNAKGVSGFPYDLNAYGDALSYVGMESDPFGEAEIESAARWFAAKVLSGESTATTIYPHNKFAAKACPGSKVMAALPEIIRRFKKYVAAGRLPGGTTTGGATDVNLTDQIKLITGQEVVYSTDKTTVAGILASTNYYTLVNRNRVTAMATQVSGLIAQVTGLTKAVAALAADPDIDAAAMQALVTQAVADALPDEIGEEVARAFADRLNDEPIA
jgi:outer membrane murein-binding lipoprotein Lpp